MAALGAKAMRMQVECPICNTKLVFEVLPQYAGRTVRVTCTNCETPIDASTDMPASSAHQIQHFEQETRLQLANGLASRMHGQAPQNSGPGVEINKLFQQNPNMQQHNVQQQIQQQQHQLQKTAQQQKQENGAGKNSTETLQYELQCPYPEVRIGIFSGMSCILRLSFLSSMLNYIIIKPSSQHSPPFITWFLLKFSSPLYCSFPSYRQCVVRAKNCGTNSAKESWHLAYSMPTVRSIFLHVSKCTLQ